MLYSIKKVFSEVIFTNYIILQYDSQIYTHFIPQNLHEVDAIIVHCTTNKEIELTQPFSVRAGTTDSSDPHSLPLRAVLEGAIFLHLVT